ncbi:MAG: HAMP domain-containing sensor histidine kinase [Planctomycetota bacterium]
MITHRVRWLIFLACGALLSVALGWVTWAALDLERKGHEQRVRNSELQRLHIALARMDAALTTVLAYETSQPWFHYASFFEPGPAFSITGREVDPGGYYQPSPLIQRRRPYFRLYFSMSAEIDLSSPQHPSPEMRELAYDQGLVTREGLEATGKLMRELDELVELPELLDAIERLRPPRRGPLTETLDGDALVLDDPRDLALERTEDEFRFRNRLMQLANLVPTDGDGTRVQQGPFVPHIVARPDGAAPELVFVRELKFGESRGVQGIWTDWPKLHDFLCSQVRDLYPEGRLRLAGPETTANRLAVIPFAFDSGPPRDYALPAFTPTRLALLGLWVAVLAAATAVGVTLQKTMELSERRRSFVSAVTHELRTPLTTFCMYSEMLADGIVTDPHAQKEYFDTLKDESVRLRRIVENVLGYARLEGRREERELERVSAEALLDRILPSLERRVAETDMQLVPDVRLRPDCAVEVDVQTIEQILFNLVDNACKYASDQEDRRVHLEALASRDEVVFAVLDHGQGIPDAVRTAIFRPFQRAAGDAEGTTPGIGLGLALARGMARTLGGDVALGRRKGFGAVFELHLPLSRQAVRT